MLFTTILRKEKEVGRFREITYYRVRRATVTWSYTGMGPLHLRYIRNRDFYPTTVGARFPTVSRRRS